MPEIHRPPPQMPTSTEDWARRFELLADPTRLKLLSHMHLFPEPSVLDLAMAAGITQTAASQALRVLRDQGWVEGRREGRLMRYRLVDDVVHQVLHFMGHQHAR
ncbi:ArsR/SmtB family transcription factor [Granulicoccus sp. GXG6511]|uniref:ArsR/SmtB family transcription factor n=1 Tax=Granulicoccus sp. GXG6511 TaxID=3381351 RepID=UPI003D7CE0BE